MADSAQGIYLNTYSGLGSFLDNLIANVGKSNQNSQELSGLAAGGIIDPNQASTPSILDKLLGRTQPAQVTTGQTVSRATPAPGPIDIRSAPQVAGTPSDGFNTAVNQTLKFEGGMNPRDTNGTPSNFGINQAANPDVNVASLNPEAAKALYKTRYWDAIGADKLPPSLQAAAFDTSVIAGPGRAQQFIAQSGGDPQKFMDLREAFQQNLLASDPAKYGKYAQAWANRNATLRAGIGAPSAQPTMVAQNGASDAPMALAGQPGASPAVAAINQAMPQTPGVQRFGLNAGQPVNSPPVAPESATNYQASNAAPAPAPVASVANAPPSAPGVANAGSPAAPLQQAPNPVAAPTVGQLTQPSPDQIKALVQNPATRALGLQLWQQAVTGKNFGFQALGDAIVRTDPRTGQAQVVYQSNKPLAVASGTDVIDPRTGQKIYGNEKASGDAKVVQIGEDQFGRKQYGVFDPETKQVKPLVAPTGVPDQNAAPSADAINLHGDDFMKTLDPQVAGQVKAIVEGRAPYPTGMLLKTPYGQQLAAYVTQADPSFETGNATARVKARNEFNTGGPSSPAGMITAGNTAIQHLGHLSDAAEALNNGKIPAINSIGNTLAQAGGGGTAVTQFNNILGKYVEEATKFYRGTGGTEADIQRDLSNLSPNMSPAQLRTALQTQVELLQSKINALQDRWKQAMGPLVGDFPIVQKDSQAALDKIAKRAGIAPSNTAGAPQSQVVPPQASGARQAPDGKFYVPDPARPGKYLRVD